jgi:hypothetical protein
MKALNMIAIVSLGILLLAYLASLYITIKTYYAISMSSVLLSVVVILAQAYLWIWIVTKLMKQQKK